MRKTTITAVTAGGFLLYAGHALAAGGSVPATPGQPFHHVQQWVIDKKQDVTVDFRLTPEGSGHFNARFSNGKRLDGDHMYAKVVLLDADNNIVGLGQHRVGIDATYGGKTRVRPQARPINIGQDAASRVVKVHFDVGHFQSVDDSAFWKKVVDIGGTLIGSNSDGFAVMPVGAKLKLPAAPLSF